MGKLSKNRKRAKKRIKEAKKVVSFFDKNFVKAGFPSGAGDVFYPKKGESEPISVLQNALNHNYGFGVPKRDFMKPAKAKIGVIYDKYTKIISKNLYKPALQKKEAQKKILELLGNEAKIAIQNAIVALDSPPLADATLKRKDDGKDNPLIDTGLMTRTVTYVVSKK